MDDFDSFVAGGGGEDNGSAETGNIFNLVSSLAGKFDGKSTNDLLAAIYKEAKKGKEKGTLTNSEIDNFSQMLSPLLNDKQRGYLVKIVEELKNI